MGFHAPPYFSGGIVVADSDSMIPEGNRKEPPYPKEKCILEMHNVWKVYPNGVIANSGIDLFIEQGKIHALLGENGAGKSTLMKILFGFERPSSGIIKFGGQEVVINSPHKAIEMGIGMVHQHFMLVPSLTVAENVVLGIEPRKGLSINMAQSKKLVEEAGVQYGLQVPVGKKVKDISVGMRQRVEIIKTLVRGANLIILDEPTAVLTPQETVELFKALRLLVEKGKTVIFITHKLNEVKQIADQITVLRRGKVIGTAEVSDVTQQDMSRMMVGRDVDLTIEKDTPNPGDPILSVDKIEFESEDHVKTLQGVSFALHRGEILGIAGVEGNGQTELIQIITGLGKSTEGTIRIKRKDIIKTSPGKMRKLGMSHIPADRMTKGVALDTSIEENIVSDRFHKRPFSFKGMLFPRTIRSFASKMVKSFDIRTDSPKSQLKMLSGGNIQKVVVSREFTADAEIIIADQPTRGIDVGAADFIRRSLIQERDKGVAILLISADLTELLEVSDRVLVLYHGEFVAHFPKAKGLTETTLGEYMLGIQRMTLEEMGEC